jgi:hypothetical protein
MSGCFTTGTRNGLPDPGLPKRYRASLAWDTYFLYGPEATWDRVPEPLLSTGRTILDTGPELRNKLAPLIKE